MGEFLYSAMLKLESIPTKVDGSLHFENIDVGVMATVLGITIVFLILIVICLLLAIFSVLVRDKNREKAQPVSAPTALNTVIPVKTAPVAQTYMDDKELVAVITAAIAASMGTSTDGLVVRRIRRAGNWNQDAIEQQQNGLY